MSNSKLWGGVFFDQPDAAAWEFGKSIVVDRELWREEIEVTLAHVGSLRDALLLSEDDAQSATSALKEMLNDPAWLDSKETLACEDIHAAVSLQLEKRMGDGALKVTAGRSRNDQIATVTRLWLMRRCADSQMALKALQGVLVRLAKEHAYDPMPGYTHQQAAQPITLGYHLLTYFWQLQRDAFRFAAVSKMADSCPLGSGALAGTSLGIDREATAKALGFSAPAPSAMDAVSDRDFVGDALHACAMSMQHLSRLAQELILWSGEMGFVKVGEAFSTGSSLMPQKRNPDVAELIRGRAARAIGNWTSFMAMAKGLPLAYNRDMQEDKPPLFDSVKLCLQSLSLMSAMLVSCEFDLAAMSAAAGKKSSTSTGLAEWLAAKGVPFRVAHERTGAAVLECEKRGWSLETMTLAQLQELVTEADADCLEALTVAGSIRSRNSLGGPAQEALSIQLAMAEALIAHDGFDN